MTSSSSLVIPSVQRARSLRKVRQGLDNLPSMPVVINRILAVLDDECSSTRDLEKHFASDAALAAKALRLANSAFFALPQPVKSIQQAAVALGYNTLRSMVMGAWVGEFLCRETPSYGYAQAGLYRHSLCVAFVARAAGGWLGLPRDSCEELFLGGLLHDVGKIPLAQAAEPGYGPWITPIDRGDVLAAEKSFFGIHHAEVGREIAERWFFPEQLREAILNHHQPIAGHDAARQAAVIHIADWCCNTHRVGLADDCRMDYLPGIVARDVLQQSSTDLDSWLDRSLPVIKSAQDSEIR